MIEIRVLVTGGAGYIGSCLLPELLKKHTVRVLDNLTYGYNGIIPHIGNKKFEFIKGDVRDRATIKNALQDMDIVIHLAAIVGYPSCKANPKLAYDVNVTGTKNITNQCNTNIIFASTGSCYGSVEGTCTEKTPVHPQTEYAQTKIQAEQSIKECSKYIILRFSTGFGLSQRPRFDLLVNDFVVQALLKKELIVFQKDYKRTFIHVKDIARSINFSLEHLNKMNNQTFNVGSKKLCLTKEQIAHKIKQFYDFDLKFAEFGEDPDKRNYYVSFKKINELGFRPRYSLNDGIQEMIKAFSFMDLKKSYYNNQVIR